MKCAATAQTLAVPNRDAAMFAPQHLAIWLSMAGPFKTFEWFA